MGLESYSFKCILVSLVLILQAIMIQRTAVWSATFPTTYRGIAVKASSTNLERPLQS